MHHPPLSLRSLGCKTHRINYVDLAAGVPTASRKREKPHGAVRFFRPVPTSCVTCPETNSERGLGEADADRPSQSRNRISRR